MSLLTKAIRKSMRSWSREASPPADVTPEPAGVPDQIKLTGKVFDLSKKKLIETERFNIYVMEEDFIGYSINASKSWEPAVSSVLAEILREGDTFLDLGANIGWFTNLAASIVKGNGRVISFEPNQQNVQLLCASLEANGFENATVYPLAVSDRRAILNFETYGSNGCVMANSGKDSTWRVQAVTVDEILADMPKVNVMKIDVEAHETFAMRGAARLLEKHQPAVLTEYHPWAMKEVGVQPEEYLTQLRDFGYQLSIIEPEGRVIDAPDNDFISEYWESLGQELIHLDLLART